MAKPFTLPVVVSICALLLTVTQFRQNVYTEKIKTLPNVNFRSLTDVAGKPGCGILSGRQATDVSQTLCLQNSGIGPARLIGVEAMFDGKVYPSERGLRWTELDNQLLSLGVDRRLLVTTDLPNTLTVPANSDIALVRWQTAGPTGVDLNGLMQQGRFGIGVCFCNYYTDCFYVTVGGNAGRRNPASCQNSEEFRKSSILEPKIDKSLVG